MTNFDNLNENQKFLISEFTEKWKCNLIWRNNYLSSVDSQIVFLNIKKDHFLNEVDYISIIKQMEIVTSDLSIDIESSIINIRDHIRENLLFKGEKITVSPELCGTVIIKNSLVQFLLRNYYDVFETPEQVDLFFNKDPKYFTKEELNCGIKDPGRHIWLTWDENDSRLSPFNFSALRDTLEICDSLGLGDFYFDNDVFLIVFRFSSNENLKKPTLADANIDNALWRPTEEIFKDYGLTEPLTLSNLASNYSPKRPEAVIDSTNLKLNFLNKKLNNHE